MREVHSEAEQIHRKIARNISVMGLSVAITMLISLILRMMLPRAFGPEKMGIFYFAESYSNLFFTFLPLGLATYINRTIPSRPQHTQEILSTILVLQLAMALLLSVLMWGTLVWTDRDSYTIQVTMIMGAWAAMFIFQKSVFHNVFIALDDVLLISRLNVAIKVILVAGCVTILQLHPAITWIAGMYLISEICGVIYLLWRARQRGFFEQGPNVDQLKNILKVSMPFYLASVLNGVYAEIDTTMLAHFANHKEVGYFGSAYKLIGVFLVLIPILQNSITPSLSRSYAAQDGTFPLLTQQLLRFLLIVSFPLSMGLILFGDYIALVLYGEAFRPSFKVVCFLTPVLTMMYLNTFMGACLNLASSGHRMASIFIGGIILNILLDAFLIPFGLNSGPGGAALAVSFATFLCEVYTFLAMAAIFPGKVFQPRLIYGCIVIFLPCWLGMFFYDQFIQMSFWQRLPIALMVPVYAFVLRVVTWEECKAFIRLFRTK